MGDHGGWTQRRGVMPNGLLPGELHSVTQVLEAERWSIAEERTKELIGCIQPNKQSEERRNAVAKYVQGLITKCFSCEVFTFGSVPLKTYLPDGDIDLTAFSKDLDLKDTWANGVRQVLETEEKSETAEFHVKEVQYIQAEVKLIKCLVENIVVDISFNQLGGLCTLCFLEEIDNLIKQDHLFKRSIILIKAWCYYESRVLGAHHGLISTYALETLVLYIFHVYNNSFAGPLEVLFRFLEFFSNFDWDNFCVSLWGPVPISSLPDMTAEAPRKDSGELLLSQPFLNACNVAYAVFPNGQENQGQPFVSKHFNVIDPLRTNNNLGRSVSKGNFYRIRSAFQLGAKSLAGLLECPKENIVIEVDKFFTDTWQRHQNGYRPDSCVPHSRTMQSFSSASSTNDGEKSCNETSTTKRNENALLPTGTENVRNGQITVSRTSSNPVITSKQPVEFFYKIDAPCGVQKQKGFSNQATYEDQIGRSMRSSRSMQEEKYSKNIKHDYFAKDRLGQARFFARTRSSPDLTDASANILPSVRQNSIVESVQKHLRKNLVPESPIDHATRSLCDPPSPAHSPSRQSVSTVIDSNSASNSYHEDTNISVAREDLDSLSHTLEMHQKEQDYVNMMATSRLHNFNGQVLPMHISSHLSVPFSPILASVGYPQRNLPASFPIAAEPHWGFNMHIRQASPAPPYYPNAGIEINSEEMVESEASCTTETYQDEGDTHISHNQDASTSQQLIEDHRIPPAVDSNVKKTLTAESNFSSTPDVPLVRGWSKFVREHRGSAREESNDTSRHFNIREHDHPTGRSTDMRFGPVPQFAAPRTKTCDTSCNTSLKYSKVHRDKQGRKPDSTIILASSFGKAKSGWPYGDSALDQVSVNIDDNESREWSQRTDLDNDVAEPNLISSTVTTTIVDTENYQLSGHDPSMPVAPMFFCADPTQRMENGSGVGPYRFFQIGPPVPIFARMLGVPNSHSDVINSNRAAERFNEDTSCLNMSSPDFNMVERPEHPAPEQSEQKPDILNSDFLSHYRNLIFGRSCQHTSLPGSLGYPSTSVVTPAHMCQFPWDGPGRPGPVNMNLLPQNMVYGSQNVPINPLQPGHNMASEVYQHHADEVPRYRGGTGTYLPKAKIPFRDRHSSNIRNHRGNYSYGKNNHDRETNWLATKSRAAGHGHGRGQLERSNSRSDRAPSSDIRTDRSWESYNQERISSSQAQSSSIGSSSSLGPTNMTYGIYPFPTGSSNGFNPVGPGLPSMVMLYPYDPSTGGPVDVPVYLPATSEMPKVSGGVAARNLSESRSDEYQGGSSCSSPDQPSSPQIQRRTRR